MSNDFKTVFFVFAFWKIPFEKHRKSNLSFLFPVHVKIRKTNMRTSIDVYGAKNARAIILFFFQ